MPKLFKRGDHLSELGASYFADGEVAARTRAKMERHLKACERCTAKVKKDVLVMKLARLAIVGRR